MGQVVNSRRGMHTADGRRLTRESTTRRGLARPGRLMPEQIYRVAGSREEALDLLRRHGYLRAAAPVAPPRRPAAAARPHIRVIGRQMQELAELAVQEAG